MIYKACRSSITQSKLVRAMGQRDVLAGRLCPKQGCDTINYVASQSLETRTTCSGGRAPFTPFINTGCDNKAMPSANIDCGARGNADDSWFLPGKAGKRDAIGISLPSSFTALVSHLHMDNGTSNYGTYQKNKKTVHGSPWLGFKKSRCRPLAHEILNLTLTTEQSAPCLIKWLRKTHTWLIRNST